MPLISRCLTELCTVVNVAQMISCLKACKCITLAPLLDTFPHAEVHTRFFQLNGFIFITCKPF